MVFGIVVIIAARLFFIRQEYRYRELEGTVQALYPRSPDSPAARLARKDFEAGDYNKAETIVALERDQIRGLDLIGQNKPEQALGVLRSAEHRLDELPDDSSTDLRVTRGYLCKDLASAAALANRSADADRYADLALRELAPIKEDTKLKEANPYLYASTLNAIANIQYSKEEYRDAITNYKIATTLVPDYAYALHDMFLAYAAVAPKADADLSAMRKTLDDLRAAIDKKTRATGAGYPLLEAQQIAILENMYSQAASSQKNR